MRLLESVLRHDRAIVFGGLTFVVGISWFWILAMSVDMYGPMRGASAWAMTTTWDVSHLFLLLAMWAVMMTAMMLPSAVPIITLYISVLRRSGVTDPARVYLLVAGYLTGWTVFSAVAALGQRLMTDGSVMTPMMIVADIRVAAIVLIAVALYQFTPLKRDCLEACRSPISLFTQYWQPGPAGAFRMGLRHGMYCLGCCWALMLLLFVGGVMNAFVIGGLTVFILIEKLMPLGRVSSKIGGLDLGLFGCWLLLP